MKKFYIVAGLCLCFALSQSQSPTWLWARCSQTNHPIVGENQGIEEGIAVCTDPVTLGAYIVGDFYNDTVVFGNVVLTNDEPQPLAVFVVKYDSLGNVIWAKGITGDSVIQVNAVAADNDGNVLITGNYIGRYIHLSNDTTLYAPSLFVQNFYVIKIGPSGNMLWARVSTGRHDGEFDGTYGYGVTCDKTGNVYATGYFDGDSVSFGNTAMPATGNGSDIFIVKYDPSGNLLWIRNSTGTADDYGESISSNAAAGGDITVTGAFTSPIMTLGSTTLAGPEPGNRNDFFIARYDSMGNLLWTSSAEGDCSNVSNGYASFVSADYKGNAYVTGSFSSPAMVFGTNTLTNVNQANNIFMVKYDASGNLKWVKSAGGAGITNTEGFGVSADLWGNVYFSSGSNSQSVYFGNDTIDASNPQQPEDDMYLLKCDSNGNIIYYTGLPCGGDDWNSLSADVSGNVYLTGDFMTGPFVLGGDTLVNTCGENDFTARFNWQCSLSASISIYGDTLVASNAAYYQWYLNGVLLPGDTSKQIIAKKAGSYTVAASNGNGCNATSNPFSISGIASLSDNNLVVYPNPSAGMFTIAHIPPDVTTLVITDALGRQVLTRGLGAQTTVQINLGDMADGVYFFSFVSVVGSVTQKLVVAR